MLPDIDAIGLRFGIPYGGMLGHRGFTHSILFAAIVALGVTIPFLSRTTSQDLVKAFAAIFIATASHGVFDALTNGGMGVAFFSPFEEARMFFPVRPIQVSPLSAKALLGRRGIQVLTSEIIWLWIPASLVTIAARLARCRSVSR